MKLSILITGTILGLALFAPAKGHDYFCAPGYTRVDGEVVWDECVRPDDVSAMTPTYSELMLQQMKDDIHQIKINQDRTIQILESSITHGDN